MGDLAGYLYPWDIADDPRAADLVAGLGLDHVVVAAVYHGTRALTPRHPRHRIVVAEHTAAYYPTDTRRWSDSPLRPPQGSSGSFVPAVAALRSAGVRAHGWLVVNHIEPWPGETGRFCVVNAYGDRYPWALCTAQETVAEYAGLLAADAAELPDLSGLELESCGWFGLDHLHGHDKIGGVQLGPGARYLMSLCFCAACARNYRDDGLDPHELRERIRAALDPIFAGGAEDLEGALGSAWAMAVAGVRSRTADRLRRNVIETVRRESSDLRVLLHASPDPSGTTAFTGVDVATTGPLVDGLVLNCWHNTDELTAAGNAPARLIASLLSVQGMGGRSAELRQQWRGAQRAGATGARLYHLGLASADDLTAIRDLAQGGPH